MNQMQRGIKSHQLKVRLLQMEASSLGAPNGAVSGLDDSAVASVEYNGIGDLTIILKKPFSPTNSDKPKAIITALSADTTAYMYASDYDRVSIQITTLAGVPKEEAVSMMIMGTNHRFSY